MQPHSCRLGQSAGQHCSHDACHGTCATANVHQHTEPTVQLSVATLTAHTGAQQLLPEACTCTFQGRASQQLHHVEPVT